MLRALIWPLLFLNLILFGGCARQDFYQPDALYQPARAGTFTQPEPGYVWAVAGAHYQRSEVHQLIWGKHYRAVWAAPVKVPLLNLSQQKGGLIPAELGGGLQTTSLTLTNSKGQSFTLRTLDKDPAKSLAPFWRKTFLSNIMRDQTSAIYPYAAVTIPPLANAGGIFHTNPALFYVPARGSGLDTYQKLFGGKLVLLEEKFENEQSLTPNFGKATEVINSKKLFQQLQTTNQYQVDQMAFARARLFDILIADLDRHEGQWNWVAYLTDAGKIRYKPIPKDRDYAYYQYADGLIPWLLTRRWLVGNIKALGHNIPDVKGLVYKGRDLDKHLLNQLSAADWHLAAKDLQAGITRPVIQEAIARLPDSVNALAGEKLTHKLTQRVATLPEMAAEYYRLLARNVTIWGSGEKEQFVVKRQADKTTLVEVFTLPEKPNETPIRTYHRVFTNQETRKITFKNVSHQDVLKIERKKMKGPEIKIEKKAAKTEKPAPAAKL